MGESLSSKERRRPWIETSGGLEQSSVNYEANLESLYTSWFPMGGLGTALSTQRQMSFGQLKSLRIALGDGGPFLNKGKKLGVF